MLLGSVLYKCQVKFLVLFKSFILLTVFCPLVLSITKKGVLKSPAVIVDLSIFTFSSISFCFIILKVC